MTQSDSLLYRLESLGKDRVGSYAIPICAEAYAELCRLNGHELALKEFLRKTDWIQESAQGHELGMHRADVLRKRIEKLESVNQELLAALKAYQKAGFGQSTDHRLQGDAYDLAIKAIALAVIGAKK